MSNPERISQFVRIISGVIGILGFTAIAFNVSQDGGLKPGVTFFASFFAGFIFLYVSFFGKYPWDQTKANKSDE